MVFEKGMWILVLVSLALCSIGFKRFVWFMSVGYGLSVAGIGVCLIILSLLKGTYSFFWFVLCVLLVVYGIRLGGFLLIREMKNASYRKKLKDVGGETTVPLFVAAVMWITCGILYLLETAGGIYRLFNNAAASVDGFMIVGIVLAAFGIYLEAKADQQKSEAKKKNPDLPAMDGLYRLCRCPNYFGEMLFWTGIFLSGIRVYKGLQLFAAILGYGALIVVMLAGAKRMETRHIRYYGTLPEYNAYADSVPLILPFVPWYHVTTPEKIAQEEAKKKRKAD